LGGGESEKHASPWAKRTRGRNEAKKIQGETRRKMKRQLGEEFSKKGAPTKIPKKNNKGGKPWENPANGRTRVHPSSLQHRKKKMRKEEQKRRGKKGVLPRPKSDSA